MTTSFRRLGFVATAAVALGVLMCSNPGIQEPIRFRSVIQVPLANTGVNVGSELERFFDLGDDARILFVDSILVNGHMVADTQSGDVVAFTIPQRDTIDDFYIEQDTLEDKVFDVTLGSIPLSNVPAFTGSIPIAGAGAFPAAPIPFTLHGVHYVRFTGGANMVTVNASSAGADITGLTVTIQGRSADIGNLNAGQDASAPLDVSGLVISDSVVNITLGGSASGPGSLSLSFSMNGTTVDSIRALDSLARFEVSFTNDYDISDTVDIRYFDLKRGVFNYSMTNNTGLLLMVLGVHHDMWELTYCEDNNLTSYTQLTGISSQDSLDFFLGRLVEAHTPVLPGTQQVFTAGNVAGTRIFPRWDYDDDRSETYVQYWVRTPPPAGHIISFGSGQGIVFTIRARNIWAERLSARTMKEYNRSADTTSTAVEYPFDSSQMANLRGKFFLDSVFVDVVIRLDLPGDALLDSVELHFEIFDPAPGGQSVQRTTMLTHVRSDSVFTQTHEITPLIQGFPEDLMVWAHARIPAFTEVMLMTDGTRTAGTLGRMSIPVYVEYRIQPFCDWHVTDTVSILFGDVMRESQPEEVENILKLADRQVELQVVVTNRTNVNVRVQGVIGPDELGEPYPAADGIARNVKLSDWGYGVSDGTFPYAVLTDSLRRIASTPDPDNLPFGYINLLGTNGFYVPARNQTDTTRIVMSPAFLESWLRCRKYSMVWFMSFMPMARDQLFDTDSLYINASIKVQGVVGTDSLFGDWK